MPLMWTAWTAELSTPPTIAWTGRPVHMTTRQTMVIAPQER